MLRRRVGALIAATLTYHLSRRADVRMADPGETLAIDGCPDQVPTAWTTWRDGARPEVVLTELADVHTLAHELAHICLDHGAHVLRELDLAGRAQLEIDAEVGCLSLLRQAGCATDADAERSTRYVVGWLGHAPWVKPSDAARRLTVDA